MGTFGSDQKMTENLAGQSLTPKGTFHVSNAALMDREVAVGVAEGVRSSCKVVVSEERKCLDVWRGTRRPEGFHVET